jgi:phthiocerol/phenolphthiocerol synthesis type-I polyketide synthase D
LRYRIASVTDLNVADLPDDRPLVGLGVDSLPAVRVRNAVRHDFELNLPMSALLGGGGLADLCDVLCAELGIVVAASAPEPAPDVLVPPRDAAERLIAAAWQEVLGVPIGIRSDFAALGGGDRDAERITAVVAARTGRDLTVSTLFAGPTIELMAGVVRAADRHTGPVRVLRESGPRPPLLFFHPGGGDTAVYRQLVDLLDPPVAAYGFDRIDETVTVEQRVARYLPELRRLQPAGPYRLAGWSFGGFLAFDMAQQLTAAGEHVELLTLIDSILPLPHQPGLSEADQLVRQFQRIGEFLETSYGKHVELPLADIATLDDEAQADLLVAAVVTAGVVDRRVSDAILTHQRASFLDSRTLERYQPAPYHGRTVFYSADSQVPDAAPAHQAGRPLPSLPGADTDRRSAAAVPHEWERWWQHIVRRAINADYLTHHGRPTSPDGDHTRLVHAACQRELLARQRSRTACNPAPPSRVACADSR